MDKFNLSKGTILTIILSTLPLILWAITPKQSPPLSSPFAFLASLGEIFGLIGITLFSLNLILSARLKFINKLFGGLNYVYKKHNTIGQLALIFLILHPLFLIPRYATSIQEAFFFLIPGTIWPRNFGIFALWLMILLIVITLYLRPKYNIWKLTHKFLGFAFFLGALHAYLIPSFIMNNPLLKGYVLIFALLGILAFTYKTLLGRFLVKRYNYKVKEITKLNHNVVEITLEPLDKKLNYNPGQFVFVSFKQDKLTESHPFSITSAPHEKDFKITVKVLGDFTKELYNNLKVGTQAEIEGPYGTFSYQDTGLKNQVWIAGGIGITPFVSFVKDFLIKKQNINVVLCYSVKDKKDAVYFDLFNELSKSLPNFTFIPYDSSINGHMSVEFIKKYIRNLGDNYYLLCAPVPMIKAIRNQLIETGVKKANIKSEEFGL